MKEKDVELAVITVGVAGRGGAAAGCCDGCGGVRHHTVLFKLEKMAAADELPREVSTLLVIGFIRLNAWIYLPHK
jgi:hypothetical protein